MANLLEKKEQITAIVIYKFLFEYSIFENNVKEYFVTQLDKLELDDIKRLYFYYGGLATKNVHINLPNKALTMHNHKFTNDFPGFSINQIIKIAESNTNDLIFDKNVTSVLKRQVCFGLRGSILKLIKMRNKLAHNLSTLKFNDNDYIELLPVESLHKHSSGILSDIEIKDDYHEIKAIFSNIIYMRIINSMLDNP